MSKETILKHEGFALAIARSIAKLKHIEGLDREGLENTARFACWMAESRFDKSKHRSFKGYAQQRIAGAVFDEIEGLSDHRLEIRRERKRSLDGRCTGPHKCKYPNQDRVQISRLSHSHIRRNFYRDAGFKRIDSEEHVAHLLSLIRDPFDRRLCELFFVYGLLKNECAELVGLSGNRVGNRIRRGVDDIRERMGKL